MDWKDLNVNVQNRWFMQLGVSIVFGVIFLFLQKKYNNYQNFFRLTKAILVFVVLATFVAIIAIFFGYMSINLDMHNNGENSFFDKLAHPSNNWNEMMWNGTNLSKQDFMNFRTPSWCLIPKITFSFGF